MKALLRGVLLALGLAGAQPAHALCTLVCSCTVSTTSVVFAAHNPLVASSNDSAGNISVSCGGVAGLLIPYSVALSAGGGGSIAARKMSNGAAKLNYNLYTSNAYTTVWGDGTGASAVVNGSITLNLLGLSAPQNLTVYARIPGSQTSVAPGNYSDTLVVTLTYF